MKDTRDRILAKAVELFNDEGTSRVSTNHICDALSISPGNLYYHFRSKEEIIVTIFERMIAQWDQSPPPAEATPENLLRTFEQLIEFLWEYRFIHREISVLYHNIEKFRAIFNEVQKRRLKEIKKLLRAYVKAGILKPMTAADEKRLARTAWFFSLYWLAYLETEGGKIRKKSVKESIEVLQAILQPWMVR